MSQVSSGDSLTATKWNAFVDNIDDLNSRWSRVGSDIAFTGGNVGIGTASPTAALSIERASNPQLKMNVTDTAGSVEIGLYDNNVGGTRGALQHFGSTYGTVASRNLTRLMSRAGPLSLYAAADDRLWIDGVNGNVGIGTTAPQVKLQVTGDDIFIETQWRGLILRDTNGPDCHRLTVNLAGTLLASPTPCP